MTRALFDVVELLEVSGADSICFEYVRCIDEGDETIHDYVIHFETEGSTFITVCDDQESAVHVARLAKGSFV